MLIAGLRSNSDNGQGSDAERKTVARKRWNARSVGEAAPLVE